MSLLRRRLVRILFAAAGPAAWGTCRRPPAPDFVAYDARGVKRRLSDYRGNLVVLNFWATWCDPCRAEIPALNRVHLAYRAQGFTVVGVAMDQRGWAAVTPFLIEHGVTYPVLLGNAAVARSYGGLKSLPQTLFLDREGRIVASHGSLLKEADLRKLVESLLAASPAPYSRTSSRAPFGTGPRS